MITGKILQPITRKEGIQMKKMQRLVSTLLVLCLIAAMIPVTASAATSGTCGDNVAWSLNNGVLTISGTGPMANYYHENDEDYSSAPWHSNGSSIKSVVIEDGVTSIGNSAFAHLYGLTKATLPDSITSIGNGAFSHSSALTNIVIPGYVTTIGNSAFSSCDALTSVIIPDSVTSIGDWAFFSCDVMTSVTIGSNVTSIGELAFGSCFALTSVVIPDSVTSIGESAFKNCGSLNRVTIGSGVASIDEKAFTNCSALTKFIVSEKNTSYSTDSHGILFNKDKTKLIQAPVTYQGHYTVPNTVTSIDDWAFYRCDALTSVTIPDSVTSIGWSAFSECDALTNVSLGNNVKTIGDYAFYECPALTSVNLPDSVTSIGECAFYDCDGLTEMAIPDRVTSIGWEAFGECDNLSSVTIGNRVEKIDKYAFSYCHALTKIFFRGNAPSINPFAFLGTTATAYYPANNSTWTSNVMQDYYGTITWVPYEIQDEESQTLESPKVSSSNVASSGKIKLTWKKVEGAKEYQVYRATSKNGTYKKMKTVTGTSYTNSTAVAGKLYYYYVVAVTKDGKTSDKSNIVSRTCDLAQPQVTVSNVASTGKIKVTWKKLDGATKYEISRATSKDGKYSVVKTSTGSYWTDTSAKVGSTYYYKVKAIASKSAANSADSEVKSTICALAQPEVTVSNVASSGKIKVSWKKIDGATKYEISRATSKDGKYTVVKTSTGSYWTDTSAKAGKTYYYKVKAIASKSAANSADSEMKSITCDLPQPTVSIALSSKKPKVSWKKVEGATKYEVYRATSKSGTYSKVKTTTSLNWKDTAAKSGKTYYYKVVAVASKTAANSAYSSVVSIKSK